MATNSSTAGSKAHRTARSELRLSETEKDVLVEAAGLLGVTVSDFIRARAVSEAEEIVRRHHEIRLPARSLAAFMAALDAPSESSERWAAAVGKSRPLQLRG